MIFATEHTETFEKPLIYSNESYLNRIYLPSPIYGRLVALQCSERAGHEGNILIIMPLQPSPLAPLPLPLVAGVGKNTLVNTINSMVSKSKS